MFVTFLHYLFMLTVAMILMRTLTMKVVQKRPGSAIAQALSYTYG